MTKILNKNTCIIPADVHVFRMEDAGKQKQGRRLT